MKTSIKTTAMNVLTGTLGMAHFVTQSTADLIMEAEAKVVGGIKEETRTRRLAVTYKRQDEVLARVSRAHALLKRAKSNQMASAE